MIMAKSHICGTKKTTIPRQELEAALDAVSPKHSDTIRFLVNGG